MDTLLTQHLIEKAILSPPLHCSVLFVINQMTYVWVYFWTLSFVPLIQLSSLVSVLHCLNNCGFMSLRIFSFVVLFQDCLGYSGPFAFSCKYWDQSVNFYGVKKKPAEILTEIMLNLQVNLGKTQSFIPSFKLVLLIWGWCSGT